MTFLKVIIAIVLVTLSSTHGSVVGPALAPAPLVTPAVRYAPAIPYNVPPFAASVNVFTKHLLAAPVVHAAHPVVHAAPPAVHAPFTGGLLPPLAAPLALPGPALHAPILPAIGRSIHPPSFLSSFGLPPVAAPALAGPALAAPGLAAPLGHPLPPAIPHAYGALHAGYPAPLAHPHALAAPLSPFGPALAGPIPAAYAAPTAPLWKR